MIVKREKLRHDTIAKTLADYATKIAEILEGENGETVSYVLTFSGYADGGEMRVFKYDDPELPKAVADLLQYNNSEQTEGITLGGDDEETV